MKKILSSSRGDTSTPVDIFTDPTRERRTYGEDYEIIDVEENAETFFAHGRKHRNLYKLERNPQALKDYCTQLMSGKDVVSIESGDIEKLSAYSQKGIIETGTPLALPTFVLHMTGFSADGRKGCMDAVYEYEDKELIVHVFVDGVLYSKGAFTWETTDEGWLKTIDSNCIYYTRQRESRDLKSTADVTGKFAALFSIVNYYLSYYEGGMAIEEKWAKKQSPSSSGKKKKKGQSQVRLVKHYTLKREWKKVHKKHKHPITCSAWGVRGHMRHYASGKVVFIAAYVKGKDRDNYKGKEYKIS